MTLADVARRCQPPTTPQTIGRLETGARALSVIWLAKLASALGVEARDLLEGTGQSDLKVAATIGPRGTFAAAPNAVIVQPRLTSTNLGIRVTASLGEYRSGDELWCEILKPADYAKALNRDVLVPRPGERFLFGRLINRDDERLQILPLGSGGRQQVLASPPWIALATRLVRTL